MSTRREFARRTLPLASSLLARKGARLRKRAFFEKRGAVLVGHRLDLLASSVVPLCGGGLPLAFGRFGITPAIAAMITFAVVVAIGVFDARGYVMRTQQRIAVCWALPIGDRELRRRDLRYLDHRHALAYPALVLAFAFALASWLGVGARVLVGAAWGLAGVMASRAGASAMEAVWRRDVRSVAGLAIGPVIGLLLVGHGTASRSSSVTYVAAAVLSTVVSFVALRYDRAIAIEAFARDAARPQEDGVGSGHAEPTASGAGAASRDVLDRAVESSGRWKTRSVLAAVLDRVLTDEERRLAVLLAGGELVSLHTLLLGAMMVCACLLPLPKLVWAGLFFFGGMPMLLDPLSVAMRWTSLGSNYTTPQARLVPALVDAWPVRPRDVVSTMSKVELVRGALASPAYVAAALALAFRANEGIALRHAEAACVIALLQLAWRPLGCVLTYVFSPASGARSVVAGRVFDGRSTLVLAGTLVVGFAILLSNLAWLPGLPTTTAIALRLTSLVGAPVLARGLFAAYEQGYLR